MSESQFIPLRIIVNQHANAAIKGTVPLNPALHRWHIWIFSLTAISLLTLFGMSSMLLTQLGFNYEMAGGSVIEKMHPGTWIALLACAVALVTGSTLTAIWRFLDRHPLLLAYTATWSLLLVYIVAVQKLPFTPIIDTFFLPVIIFFLLDRLSGDEKKVLASAVHFFMLLNSLLGLSEVMTGWRLTPYVVGGEEITADWRATALMGHPLANACITGTYALMMVTGEGKGLSGHARTIAILGAMIGMIVFGGRAAMVFLLALSLPFFAVKLLKGIAFGRMSYKSAAIGAAALLIVPGVMAALFSYGAFDKFIGRFIDDRGSAATRVVMFELFQELPLRDILLGPHPDAIATLRTLEGLDYGIESFWVATILSYGALISLIFFVGIFLYCYELVRSTSPSTWLPLMYFFGVASTSVSLSAKSCIFALFTAMVIVLSTQKSVPTGSRSAYRAPKSA
ncbi:MAG: VpsF family polysaccharide biosynthesis protein [Beijerinckiaceae bacterium]